MKHDKDMSCMCIQLLVRYINLTEGTILCTGTDVSILYSKRAGGYFNIRIVFLAFTIIWSMSFSKQRLTYDRLDSYTECIITARRDFVQEKK